MGWRLCCAEARSEKKQEDLTGEIPLSERMDFCSGIWGSLHFLSHFIPKSKDEREFMNYLS